MISREIEPDIPWWMHRLVSLLLSLLLGFSLTGLVLALFGIWGIGPALALGGAASYTVQIFWYGYNRPLARSTGGTVPALAVLVVVLTSVGINASNGGEHLIVDGEPAVVINAVRDLVVSGDLSVDAGAAPFIDARLGFDSTGFKGRGSSGGLRSSVPHLLVGLDAAAAAFGTSALLGAFAFIGGIALLSLYWFAARLVRPWTAFFLTSAMAVSLPFVQLSRDAYPELMVMAFVFGGLGLLWGEGRQLDNSRALLAGLFIGAAALARPEWTVLVIAVAVFVVVEWFASAPKALVARRRHRLFLGVLALGFSGPVALGVIDAQLHDVDFLETLNARWVLAVAVSGAVALGVIRLSQLSLRRPEAAWEDPRRGVAFGLAIVIVVGGLAALLLRPASTTDSPSAVVAQVQQDEGVVVDGTRLYSEDSARWIVWYMGPGIALAGLVGLGGLTFFAASGDDRRPYLFLLVTGIASFVFLADQPGVPVQVEVMRSLVPVTIPAVLIGTGWLIERLTLVRSRFSRAAKPLSMVVLAVLVAVPFFHTATVWDTAEQQGARQGVARACGIVGRDSAVVVLEADSPVGDQLTQTIRGFCRIPVARAADLTPSETQNLARAWAEEGKKLVLLSGDSAVFPPGSGAHQRIAIEYRSLEHTVESRPSESISGSIEIFIAEPAS
ncbi:MAG: hypothetical protein OEM94_06535 [Acidimicrobiia bacterium]|nr:hypothetical protein [Acidimicrobiia bacterium]